MHRVVVTGIGGICALGQDWPSLLGSLRAGRNAVRAMPEWDRYEELGTRLAAPVVDFTVPAEWTRKQLRSMGRVSQLAVRSATLALADAGLLGDPCVRDGTLGVACGSSVGSTADIRDFAEVLMTGHSTGINANSYVRMMPHTTAANIGIFLGITGRIIPTSSACTSASQAIGYAYESIRFGRQALMLAGGAEELCPSQAMAFDQLYATSRRNESPALVPQPYDRDRDGLVVGEGAGILLLEELDHARARGARIYAELVGFASNSDGTHVTRPNEDTQRIVMQMALQDAGLAAAQVGYVNGHGTATEHGDIAETQATQRVFGTKMPISSQKSYLGHTMGACGALEAWITIEGMRLGWFPPTINLQNPDPRCGELDYITGTGRALQCEYAMSNNFAFGGINTSMIFRRWDA
jgi:3-oxoacyl-[acyl-carrier-protein] synthase II